MKDYLLYRMADGLSNAVPSRFAYWIGMRTADVYFRRDRRGREAVMDNLRHVYRFGGREPDGRELRRAARETFHLFGKYLVDFCRFSRLSEVKSAALFTVENPGYIDRAVACGRGVIGLSAHIGNWELAGALMVARGHKVNAVVLSQSSVKVDEFFQARRRRRGLQVLPVGGAARHIMRALERREFVALLADRDYSPHVESARFFGAPARLPRGPAWLGERTGAPILPGFLIRRADDTFLLRFHEPILPDGRMKREEIQARICRVLQEEIAAHPTQWFMFHSVWNGPGPEPGRVRAAGQAGGSA